MTGEEKIAELINVRDNFNYTLAPREVFDDAIKAIEFVDKMHQLRTDYNNYKISQDERIKAEVALFKEMGI